MLSVNGYSKFMLTAEILFNYIFHNSFNGRLWFCLFNGLTAPVSTFSHTKKGLPKFKNVLIQHPVAQTHTIQLNGNKRQRQHVDRIIGGTIQ